MKPALLVVLALWCFCTGVKEWKERQRTREQGNLEQGILSPQMENSLSLNSPDATLASGRHRKPKGSLMMDIADVHVPDNFALHFFKRCWYLWCRHVLCMLRWGECHRLQTVCDIDAAERFGLDQHNAVSMQSNNRYADRHLLMSNRNAGNDLKFQPNLQAKYIRSNGNIRLLDVVDDTSADRQANAVRRQGIDSALLKYAGLTLSVDTQTGAVYNVGLPPSLEGITAQVTRLIPDSFLQADFKFNEFTFPVNASFSPSGDFVALVYREISSFTVYTLPSEYQYGGPVVGVISSSSNTTSIDPSLPPGSIFLPANSYININLPMSKTIDTTNTLCAFFSSNGSMFVTNPASPPNVCLSSTLGDFALVIKGSSTTSPTQSTSSPAAMAPPSNGSIRSSSSPSTKPSTNWKLIVGATCLTLAGLAFLVAIALIGMKLTESIKYYLRTRYTGNDEALQDSLVGGSLAPTAGAMRTKPALEIDVARFSS